LKELNDLTNEPDIERLRSTWAMRPSKPHETMTTLQDLAENGSIISLYYIGHMAEKGIGAPENKEKALRYYQLSAERGSIEGLFMLGALYWRMKEFRKALDAFEIAANKGHPRAIYWLAIFYLQKSEDPARLQKAEVLLRRSASMGHIQSSRKLGKLMMSGHFGLSNILPGIELYVRAAVTGARLAVGDPSNECLDDLPVN